MGENSKEQKEMPDETEEAVRWLLKRFDERHEHITIFGLGITYGIVGNLFVQYLFPVSQRIILRQFDNLFYFNLAVCILSLLIIIVATILFRLRMRHIRVDKQYFERWLKEIEKAEEKIERARGF